MNIAGQQTFHKAEVVKITAEGKTLILDKYHPYQTVVVRFLDEDKKGQEITIEQGKTTTLQENQKVQPGEKVVVVGVPTPQGLQYQIADKYRLDTVIVITVIFFVLVILLARLKGLGSIVVW